MSLSRPLKPAVLLMLGYGAPFIHQAGARGEPVGQITAVYSEVSDDYIRTKLPDGTFQAEAYAFGEGGYYRAPISDETIDMLSFMDIARTIAGPLKGQSFAPTKDPNKAKLLIMVYWGMTSGTNDPGSANFVFSIYSHARSAIGTHGSDLNYDSWAPVSFEGGIIDNENAGILGYGPELLVDSPRMGLIHNVRREDLVDDIEHNRYFVVLMAYDFQVLWKQRKHKLLWETRFSIREQGNDFEKVLPAISRYASQYFGQGTHGRLIRETLPEGNVEVGAPESLGVDSRGNDSISDTTLIAAPGFLSGQPAGGMPDLSSMPPKLAAHIAEYQRERAALQDELSAKIKAQAPGDETRRAIDAFNMEHSAQIAALNQDAESIRGELAKFSAANPQPADGQSAETLVRQFNDSVRDIEIEQPLFTHRP